MARCIDEAGVGFLFAQSLHASMRHAGPTRREIGIRTVFNILGPLTNPAGAKRQLLGVYDARLAPVMAEVAGRLGAERVLVVNGHPGMDEVSAQRPDDGRRVRRRDRRRAHVYEITPESVGIARGTLADIAGGDAAENAAIVRACSAASSGRGATSCCMNAAAALLAAGKAADLAEGVALRARVDRLRPCAGGARRARRRQRRLAARRRASETPRGRPRRELPRRHGRAPARRASPPSTARSRPADRERLAAARGRRATSRRAARPRRRRRDRRGQEGVAERRADRAGLRGVASRRCTTRTAARRRSACSPSPTSFGGSFTDLSDVADAVDIPVLCKDFVVDPVQLFVARGHGADAVLLMVSVLGDLIARLRRPRRDARADAARRGRDARRAAIAPGRAARR